MSKGKFIVFEGLDGSGKTTQIKLLEKHLQGLGRRVFLTAEPTVSISGGMLRDALSGVTKKTPSEMASMFVLDRIFHNVNPVSGINKMLEYGYDVICDRYYYSSLAYQGSETDYCWVRDMNLNCPDIRHPDLCIFIDLDPAECVERIAAGRTTVEIYEKREILETFRRKYLEIFDDTGDRVAIIDGNGSAEEVAGRVASATDELFEKN